MYLCHTTSIVYNNALTKNGKLLICTGCAISEKMDQAQLNSQDRPRPLRPHRVAQRGANRPRVKTKVQHPYPPMKRKHLPTIAHFRLFLMFLRSAILLKREKAIEVLGFRSLEAVLLYFSTYDLKSEVF